MNVARMSLNSLTCMGGMLLTWQAIELVKKYVNTTKESYFTLLKVSAVVIPIFGLMKIAIEKYFNSLGWQQWEDRFIVELLFSCISSAALAYPLLVGLGVTKFYATVWVVSFTVGNVFINLKLFKSVYDNFF